MTDLVTRLLSQANLSHSLSETGLEQLFCEAADALETATIQRRVANLNNEGNLARAEKAEAEAAALREALKNHGLHPIKPGTRDTCLYCEALSQPGPGAAFLERVKKIQSRLNEANADRDHLEHKIDQLEARVKKLEALAEAVFSLDREMKQQHGQFMRRATSVAPRLWETVGDALAALEKKP